MHADVAYHASLGKKYIYPIGKLSSSRTKIATASNPSEMLTTPKATCEDQCAYEHKHRTTRTENATAWTTKPLLIFGYDLHGLKLYPPKDQNAPLHENDPKPSLKYKKPHGKVPPTYHTEPDHSKPSWAEQATQNKLNQTSSQNKNHRPKTGFQIYCNQIGHCEAPTHRRIQ